MTETGPPMPDSLLDIAAYLADFALFLPGVLLSAGISLVAARRVGRWLAIVRPLATLLVFAVGLILSATVTPSRGALRHGTVGTGTCDLGRVGLAPFGEILSLHDPAFNILLFLPLGLALGSLPRSGRQIVLIVIGLILSPAVEITQLLATSLDRACQSSDVVDNLTGLGVGLVAGWLVRKRVPTAAGPPAEDHMGPPFR